VYCLKAIDINEKIFLFSEKAPLAKMPVTLTLILNR